MLRSKNLPPALKVILKVDIVFKKKGEWHMKVKVGVESESEKAGLYYSIKMLRRKNLPAALRAPLGRVFKVLGFSA